MSEKASYVAKRFRTFRRPITRRLPEIRITVHSTPTPAQLVEILKNYKGRYE